MLLGVVMVELNEGFFDVVRHEEADKYVAMNIVIVPIKGYSNIRRARPIGCDGVAGLEAIQKMLNIIFVSVFNAQIVDNKRESDVTALMDVKTLSESTW